MDPLLFEQLGQALRNDDAEIRYKAIQELARTNDPGAVRMALSHAKSEGKVAILNAIAEMAQTIDGDWESLILSQLNVSNETEICRILYVMSFINDKKLQIIAADLFGHDDMSVRKAALKCLGKLGKNEKLSLFRQLVSDKEIEKRLRAVQSIAAFKHKDVIPVLKTGMRDKEYIIREAAWKSLTALKDAGIAEAVDFIEKSQKPVPPEATEEPPEEIPEDTSADEPNEPDRAGCARLNAVDRLLGEGKTCKNCVHSKPERTDRQKMAPLRKWCVNLKKEVLPKQTCIRGKWNG